MEQEHAMPSMTIKSIPDKLYHRLKQSARVHHRSLNKEAIACLEQSLGMAGPAPETRLARIDTLRSSLANVRLTDRILKEAKASGRP